MMDSAGAAASFSGASQADSGSAVRRFVSVHYLNELHAPNARGVGGFMCRGASLFV
jgi:hypothetical protein